MHDGLFCCRLGILDTSSEIIYKGYGDRFDFSNTDSLNCH